MTTNNKSYIWFWILYGFSAGALFALLAVQNGWSIYVSTSLFGMLNSNFFVALFGAAFGALAAAYVTVYLNHKERERLLHADINVSIGVLHDLKNTLLNIKKDYTLPMFLDYKENVSSFKEHIQTKKSSDVYKLNFIVNKIHCPKLSFDVPTEHIYSKLDKMPKLIGLFCRVKNSTEQVMTISQKWNEIAEEYINTDEKDKKLAMYFSLEVKKYDLEYTEQMIDSRLPDILKNFCFQVDAGLFNIENSIETLREYGKKVLPNNFSEKRFYSEVKNEYEELIPSDGYIEEWRNELDLNDAYSSTK